MISRTAGITGNAVVMLGAGASRSEMLAQEHFRPQVLLPTRSSFLEELEELEAQSPAVGIMLQAARDLFGAGPEIGVERCFSAPEFHQRIHEANRGGPAPETHWTTCSRLLEEFQRVLLDVLVRAGVAGGVDDHEGVDPVLHRALVGTLERGDAVISFNYDTLMDRALAEAGEGLWDAGCGYGVTAEGEVAYWGPAPGACPPSRALRLLKMHGSVHWDMFGPRLRLTRPPYRACCPSVIPPAWHRLALARPLFADVWNLAYLRLRVCDSVLVLGYSLPPTDTWTQKLVRSVAEGRRSRPLVHLVIANQDDAAVARIVQAWCPALGPRTRVIRLGDFARAVDFLTELPVPRTLPIGSVLPGQPPFDTLPLGSSRSRPAPWLEPLPAA